MIDIETRLRTDADGWRERAEASYPDLDALLPGTQHRRRAGTVQALAAAAVMVVLAGLATVIARQHGGTDHAPAAPITPQAVPYPIGINGSEAFQPLLTVPRGALSADRAWADYTAHRPHPSTHVPPGLEARYGVFTRPHGSIPPIRVSTWRVWGYRSSPFLCPNTLAPPPPGGPKCVSWEFLDAFTGQFVEAGMQEVS